MIETLILLADFVGMCFLVVWYAKKDNEQDDKK